MYYRCNVCGVKFEEYSSLNVHRKTHDVEELSYQGDIGDVSFSDISSSPDKIDKKNKALYYRCNVCGVKFEEYTSLKVHEWTHDQDRSACKVDVCNVNSLKISSSPDKDEQTKVSHRCSICGVKFEENSSLEVHRMTHNEDEFTYKGDVCAKTFSEISSFPDNIDEQSCRVKVGEHIPHKVHERSHPANRLWHKQSHTGKGSFKSDVCDKNFTQNGVLISLKHTHTGDRPFKCDICDKRFQQSGGLVAHKRTHTSERPSKCDICDKMFNQKGGLVEHQRTHTGERPFNCDIYYKSFKQSGGLTHTGERPFKCDICDKRFTKKSKVVEHKRVHTGERPFKCDICNKGFKKRDGLVRHKRTHTGNKPFMYDIYYKRFKQSGGLVAHKWTHTGENPCVYDICYRVEKNGGAQMDTHRRRVVQDSSVTSVVESLHGIVSYSCTGVNTQEKGRSCDICEKRFTLSGRVMEHKPTHTGEKPFECDICNKSLIKSCDLVKHKRIHSGESPFKCDVCG